MGWASRHRNQQGGAMNALTNPGSNEEGPLATSRLVINSFSPMFGLMLLVMDKALLINLLYTFLSSRLPCGCNLDRRLHIIYLVDLCIMDVFTCWHGSRKVFRNLQPGNFIGRMFAVLGAFTVFIAFSLGCRIFSVVAQLMSSNLPRCG